MNYITVNTYHRALISVRIRRSHSQYPINYNTRAYSCYHYEIRNTRVDLRVIAINTRTCYHCAEWQDTVYTTKLLTFDLKLVGQNVALGSTSEL